MSLLIFGIILPWLIIAFGGWVVYQLLRQNGRILLRLEALEHQLNQLPRSQTPDSPTGLPLGALAPDFELSDLSGQPRRLSDWLGRRVLLIFFNPQCGFCQQMAEDLSSLPFDGADERPIPLVVTTGDGDENRRFFETHEINCPVLIQEQMTIATEYGVNGTPMGYLIDERGRIASALAAGAQALLALSLGGNGPFEKEQKSESRQDGSRKSKSRLSLANSRLKRDGLSAGTRAPDFRLPLLTGGEVSLEEFKGRKLMLVFSDPHCEPCNLLASRLEQFFRQNSGIQILMVSRGSTEDNLRKVAEHGLTFPVALQKQWEISRRYALFATPVAYLIDEDGLIARDVAAGVEQIISLLSEAGTERRAYAVIDG